MSQKISAIAIGSDVGMWEGLGNPTMKRQMEYAKRCRKFIILCYTTPGFRTIHIGDDFHVYPTNSINRVLFFPDALRLGLMLIKYWSLQIIITQDTFFFGLVGVILKKMTGLSLVVHYHSGFWTNPYWMAEKKINKVLACLGRYVSRQADVIRTVSTDIREALIREGFDSSRIFYATPPVEARSFLKEDKDKEKRIVTGFCLNPHKTFIYIGRLSREKNLSVLLRAVSRLTKDHKDLKLVIIGMGPEERRILSIIDQLCLRQNVIFVGTIPNFELKSYFRAAISLVIPSYYEGTAKVMKEAAFSGRPTITTKTSGVSDAIKDGETGLVVPIGDEQAMAQAMDFFVRNPDKALLMGKRAREFIRKKFNYQKDVDRVVDVWKHAILLQKNQK